MKKQELELLVQAGDVETVVISRDWETPTQPSPWAVWVYGGAATAARGNLVHTARGDCRWFRTLDSAYAFVCDCGFRGKVEVEDLFRPDGSKS